MSNECKDHRCNKTYYYLVYGGDFSIIHVCAHKNQMSVAYLRLKNSAKWRKQLRLKFLPP